MNWKEINEMITYLRELGYELYRMSVPEMVSVYKEITKCQ